MSILTIELTSTLCRTVAGEYLDIAHRARHIMRWRQLYEQVRRWPAARRHLQMSQYHTKWKIWAACLLLLPLCVVDARAGFGSSQSLDAGVRECMANASFKAVGSIYSGTCLIPLPAMPWSPVSAGSSGAVGQPSVYKAALILLNSNSAPGYTTGLQLTINGPLILKNRFSQNVSWPAGSIFRPGVNTNSSSSSPGVTCPYINGGVGWAHPQDGDITTSESSGPCGVQVPASSVLTWSISLPVGATIYYPNVLLSIDGTSALSYGQLSVAVGGQGNADPTPTNPPVAPLPAPTCTAMNVTYTNYGFASVSRTSGTAGALVAGDRGYKNDFTMTCTGTNTQSSATATVYAETPGGTISGAADTRVKFTDPALYLQLQAPGAWPAGVTGASGQTAGQALTIGPAGAPRALWSWNLPATNGGITVSKVSLTPSVYQTGGNWQTTYGAKTAQVKFTTVIQ